MNKHQQASKLCGEQADRTDEHCDFFHEGAREGKPAQLLFSLNNQSHYFHLLAIF